jgi:hypothetical protein
MTHNFGDDLGRRLADLAEPAPALPPGVLPAVRQRAARQRQRGMVLATAVLVLLAGTGVGFARVVLPPTSGAEPVAEQPVPEQPANGLLGWPVHNQFAVDVDDVARAWDRAAETRHTEVRLLFAGPVGATRVVVAEGLDRARRPRLAAFWTHSTRQETAAPYRLLIGADVAGFGASPPDHLVLEIPPLDSSVPAGDVLALTSPKAAQTCRLGGGVAGLVLDPSTGFATAAAGTGALRNAFIECPGSTRSLSPPMKSQAVKRTPAIAVHVAGP